jgi:hypothetical protein
MLKAVSNANEALCGFLTQRNISENNIKTIESFLEINHEDLHEFAQLVLEIARFKPHKRRRWRWLAEHHPKILQNVEQNENLDWLVDEASVDGAWPKDEEC